MYFLLISLNCHVVFESNPMYSIKGLKKIFKPFALIYCF